MSAQRTSLNLFYCFVMSWYVLPDLCCGAIPGVLGTLKCLSWHRMLSFGA